MQTTAKRKDTANHPAAQIEGLSAMECKALTLNMTPRSPDPRFGDRVHSALFDDEPLACGQLQNHLPSLRKKFLDCLLLLLEVFPAVIIEDNDAARHDKRIQPLEGEVFRFWGVQVNVKIADFFRANEIEGIRHKTAYRPYIGILHESLTDGFIQIRLRVIPLSDVNEQLPCPEICRFGIFWGKALKGIIQVERSSRFFKAEIFADNSGEETFENPAFYKIPI
jgi:hypothetical protein